MSVKLLNVRLAFPNLFTPKAGDNGDLKFSAAFIFPREHPAMPEIIAAMRAAAAEKWGEPKADEMLASLKAGNRLAVHDGDSKTKYDGYKGNLFMNASNKVRPLVIGGGADGKAPLVETDGKPYSGCYVNAMVSFWAQDNKYGQRINASLMGVQFLKDGERLAGGETASADDFDAIVPEKPAAANKTGAASLF